MSQEQNVAEYAEIDVYFLRLAFKQTKDHA